MAEHRKHTQKHIENENENTATAATTTAANV